MTIVELREKFRKAENNQTCCNQLYDWLKKNAQGNILFLGYLGAVQALKAKYEWNPLSKLYYIQQASQSLEKALNLEEENIEVHFLRFSIEHNIPSFLGYSSHIQKDLDFIIKNITNCNIDKSMQIKIAKFLLDSQRCAIEQVKILENFIENL